MIFSSEGRELIVTYSLVITEVSLVLSLSENLLTLRRR